MGGRFACREERDSPNSRCRTGMFAVHILTVSDRVVICTISLHSSYLLRYCLHHTRTIYGQYKKKKRYTAMAQSMKTNTREECDLFQRWCIMMTVETHMNRTSLTAWLYHINYIFGKFQNTELNSTNMLTGITSRREFYLHSTRKQKCWKTNKKSDWPNKILMNILLEGEDAGWEFFTN